MDYITKHYQNKCQVLAEQVRLLENHLKVQQLNEEMTASPMQGQMGTQQVFGAQGASQNDMLYMQLQELLRNWADTNYWAEYGSPGEMLGAILGKITGPPSAGPKPQRQRRRQT